MVPIDYGVGRQFGCGAGHFHRLRSWIRLKRGRSRYWQCSTYIAGRNRRVSTKQESLAQAKDFAEDWYLDLRGKNNRGELKAEKTFKQAAQQFLREYEAITEGQRHPGYVEGHERRLNLHLIPFLGDSGLSEITPGLVQEYRIFRLDPKNKPIEKPFKQEPASA